MINQILFLLGIIRYYINKKPFPLFVNWAVTNVCNLDCIYCCGAYHNRYKNDFSTQEILDILNELSKAGTRMINFNGGEPLLRKDIGILINSAKAKGIIVGMNTNGMFIKDRISEMKNLDSICVSIDGNEKENDLNRGKGTFSKIMEGIICAVRNKMEVHTNTVITKNNINSVDFILNLAQKYNLKSQFHLPFEESIYSKDEVKKTELLNDEDIRSLLREIIEYKKNGENVQFSLESYRYALDWPFSYQKKLLFEGEPIDESFKISPCYAGKLMCFIDADGTVYPCSQLIGNFPGLKIQESGFKKAFKNLKQNKCRSCYFVCHLDFNQIFNLNFKVILNSIRQ